LLQYGADQEALDQYAHKPADLTNSAEVRLILATNPSPDQDTNSFMEDYMKDIES
jgi:hypothetical protein